jgi:putative inorganic carbon (hco3(-)) transporter
MLIRLLPIWVYLAALFIAPQLWVRSMLNWPVDFFIYPFWFFVLLVRGRVGRVFQLGVPDKFFLGLILWMVLSWVTNGPPAAAPLILINYIKWFILYRLVVASIDSPASLRHVGIIIIVLAGTIAIEAAQHLNSVTGLGWAGQTFGWVDASAETTGLDARTRWVGIFDGPGVFCVMFTVALPFALQYLSNAYPFWKRVVAAGLLVPLFGYAIYSTGSRGGILATLAVCGCWVISRYRISFDKLIWMAIGGAVFMILGPAYLTSTTDSNSSAQHRVEMWVEGIEMVQQNPLFGIGKGKFGQYTGKLIAHNSGIENMGEMGMPGLFLWIGLIYFGMKSVVARYLESQDARERELLTALGICVIGYLVSSLFVTLEYETWYFILALTAAASNWTSTPTTIDRKDLINIGATSVAFFVLIKAFVMVY